MTAFVCFDIVRFFAFKVLNIKTLKTHAGISCRVSEALRRIEDDPQAPDVPKLTCLMIPSSIVDVTDALGTPNIIYI